MRSLSELSSCNDILIVHCNKNLEPAVINRDTYISRAFTDHLSDTNVYQELTEDKANLHMLDTSKRISYWLHKFSTSTKTRKGIAKQELAYL